MIGISRAASLAASLAAALAAAGCGHVPVSTMWALRNFDGLNVDPAFLRAAVRIPEGFAPRPGGVKVIVAWGKKGAPETERKVEIVLRETSLSAEGPMLEKERRTGAQLFVYRVPPDEAPRLRALQAEVARAKSVGAANYGSVGVGADACRTRDLPAGPVYMTTFLKVSEETGWLTVLKDVDLRAQISADKPLDELVPPCEKFPARVEPASG